MAKKISWKEIGLHVLGAVCFLLLPLLFNPRPRDWDVLLHSYRTLEEIIIYFLMIGFFYLNYYVLIPKFFFTRKFLQYVLLAFACFLVAIVLPDLVADSPPPGPSVGERPRFNNNGPLYRSMFHIMHFGQNLFLFLIVLFFSLMVRIRNRLKISEKEKLNVEISYLKAQINPHFLFNTLNGIYSLALQKSNDTANAVVKLSNMMRYVLTEASAEMVPLQKEIEYLKNYIELQQLRFGEILKLEFKTQGDEIGKSIAPLLIIPLVENAFKYGVSPEEASMIKININISDTSMEFLIENNKVNVRSVEKTGLGLTNIKKRLALLYPNRYQLNIQETQTDYSAKLILQLS